MFNIYINIYINKYNGLTCMAIKRIENKSSSEVKPFLNEFLTDKTGKEVKEITKNLFGIQTIIRVKSGKGLILCSLEFNVFVWKNSNFYEALMEFEEDYTVGYPMIEPLNKEGKFNIVFDDEILFDLKFDKEQTNIFPKSIDLKVDGTTVV